MKLTKIFGIVLGLHVLAIGIVFVLPGCKTTKEQVETPEPQSSEFVAPEPVDNGLHPDFNAGFTEAPSSSASRERVAPTRPTSWDMVPAAEDTEVIQPLPSAQPDTGPDTSFYIVERGDSLWAIAREHGVTLSELLEANGFTQSTVIHAGQEIMIPASGHSTTSAPPVSMPSTTSTESKNLYTVKSGDTLSGIAKQFGTSVAELKAANNLGSDMIRVRQTLAIPTGAKNTTGQTEPRPASSSSSSRVPVAGLSEDLHVVKAGETPSGIARKYGMSTIDLMDRNNITDATKLRIGQTLIVKSTEDEMPPSVKKSMPPPAVTEPAPQPQPTTEELNTLLEDEEDIPVIPYEPEGE